MNWKLRMKNKTTLTTLLLTLVTAAYGVLAALGVTPSVTQEQATNLVVTVVALLAALGVVVDPTTPGVGDSERAKSYTEPGTPGGRED
ncbi:MAG: phage holin [Coriobacteriales bacterium]